MVHQDYQDADTPLYDCHGNDQYRQDAHGINSTEGVIARDLTGVPKVFKVQVETIKEKVLESHGLDRQRVLQLVVLGWLFCGPCGFLRRRWFRHIRRRLGLWVKLVQVPRVDRVLWGGCLSSSDCFLLTAGSEFCGCGGWRDHGWC